MVQQKKRAMGVSLNQPARVRNVYVNGLLRTKDDVIKKIVEKLGSVSTMEQLLNEVHTPKSQLESLRAFKNVEVSVDVSKEKGASEFDYDVSYNVKEERRLKGGIFFAGGLNNRPNVVLNGFAPNLFGRGETMSLEQSYDIESKAFRFNFTKPLCPWSKMAPTFSISAQLSRSNWQWSNLAEEDRGVIGSFSFTPADRWSYVCHFTNMFRNLIVPLPTTPMDVREHAGHDLKASVQHAITYDSRDASLLPRKGSLVRLVQEYAGFNGNACFHKHQIELHKNWPLLKKCSLQLSATVGSLYNLSPSNKVKLVDKFYLGGPLNVRGFRMFGIGPKKDDCALGGNSLWAAGIHLYTPIPYDDFLGSRKDSIRTHFFLNAGRLEDKSETAMLKENFASLKERVRLSAGVGLVMSINNFARVEINYCVPISSERCDQNVGGLQFGIGLNYI